MEPCSHGQQAALEDELFLSLPEVAVLSLVEHALETKGAGSVDCNIRWASGKTMNTNDIRNESIVEGVQQSSRDILGRAARKGGWFKTVGLMKDAARTIVGPAFEDVARSLTGVVTEVFGWIGDGGR